MITVDCVEKRNRVITHKIEPLIFYPEMLKKFYDKASQFPVLFGKEIKTPDEFVSIFLSYSIPSGDPIVNGLFWAIDNLDTGVFYITNICDNEADAHFAFFDKTLVGREPLVKAIMNHVFKEYGFNRLNVSIPRYVNRVHGFALKIGCRAEGEKRSAAKYKGKWFDVRQYGILKDEILSMGV